MLDTKSIYDVFQFYRGQRIFLRSVHTTSEHLAKAETWDIYRPEIKGRDPQATINCLVTEMRRPGISTK